MQTSHQEKHGSNERSLRGQSNRIIQGLKGPLSLSGCRKLHCREVTFRNDISEYGSLQSTPQPSCPGDSIIMGAAQGTGGGAPACHSVRGGPQHLTQPSESEKTSQKRWQNQGTHFSRPKATTDPDSGQALWALWGHLALLPNPSPRSLTPGASDCLCFLQGLPCPQPFPCRCSSEPGLS